MLCFGCGIDFSARAILLFEQAVQAECSPPISILNLPHILPEESHRTSKMVMSVDRDMCVHVGAGDASVAGVPRTGDDHKGVYAHCERD